MPVFRSTLFHPAAFIIAAAVMSAGAQTHFTFTSATGNNMTVLVRTVINPTVNGQPLASGDEIGVFTPAGLCVGARVWDGINNRSIAVWGDNDMTTVVDGAKGGETLSYRVWDSSLAQEVVAAVTYDTLPPATNRGTYAVNGIAILTSLTAQPVPAAPAVFSPVNGATGASISPTLVWDTSSGAARYELELATDSAFTSIVLSDSTLTSTSRTVGPLVNSTTYYWRVRAKNTSGTSDWTVRLNFTTIIAAPAAPVLVRPVNGDTAQPVTPMLKWSTVNGATSYHMQVATDTGFSSLFLQDTALTDTERVIILDSSTTYYWRVRAKNAGGSSAWAVVWSFRTGTTAVLPYGPSQQCAFSITGFTGTVRYSIPLQCRVCLKYYDIQGRPVASPVDRVQGPGNYSLAVPVSTWAHGTYIQVFKAGSFTRKKMVAVVR